MKSGYFVREEFAKFSARYMSGEEEGNGDEDFCRGSLLSACHRRFGLSEAE